MVLITLHGLILEWIFFSECKKHKNIFIIKGYILILYGQVSMNVNSLRISHLPQPPTAPQPQSEKEK